MDTTTTDTQPAKPDLLTVCKAQDALLRSTETLAKSWRKSGNPARRADGTQLLAHLRGR